MSALDVLIERRPELTAIEDDVVKAFDLLVAVFRNDGKVLICGNGGSAADAGHIVGELMKGMVRRRPLSAATAAGLDAVRPTERRDYLVAHLEGALPAIDLGSQQALLSAIGNDTAGDMGFAQQVMGYGERKDVLWALSTSGNSRNVVLAAATARARGMRVLSFTGSAPSELSELADVTIAVPATTVQTIQELHLPIYHALCEMLEATFFEPSDNPRG